MGGQGGQQSPLPLEPLWGLCWTPTSGQMSTAEETRSVSFDHLSSNNMCDAVRNVSDVQTYITLVNVGVLSYIMESCYVLRVE